MSGIIVGIDGSEHAHRALEWAAREAALRQVALNVVTVYQPVARYWVTPVPYVEEEPGIGKSAAEDAQQATDGALAGLGDGPRPASVTVRAVAGLPAEEILAVAADADMIVVGSRGSGGFKRLLLGSVSSQVVHHAHRPVVVIPADSD